MSHFYDLLDSDYRLLLFTLEPCALCLEPFFSIDLHCEKGSVEIIFYYNLLFNGQY